jgi:DNA mismatch endonuclease, patch repair protein
VKRGRCPGYVAGMSPDRAATRKAARENPPIDPARSALMARIRSRDTGPELLVRKALHAAGFRFRLHRRDLPGTPDIVLPRHGTAILVHGCFWHRHEGCRMAGRPKTRTAYWDGKFAANLARDRAAVAALECRGWRVEIIWECEARRPEHLAVRVQALRPAAPGSILEMARAPRPCGKRSAAAKFIQPL